LFFKQPIDRKFSGAKREDNHKGVKLRRMGWKEEELKRRKKGDKQKMAVARRLREETPMTWGWIAQRLWMGAGGSVANSVRALESK
jgi:hypothetical protein